MSGGALNHKSHRKNEDSKIWVPSLGLNAGPGKVPSDSIVFLCEEIDYIQFTI
jgi:kynureninase